MSDDKQYGLGCLKDPKDSRDISMRLILPPITAPAIVDYTEEMSPVRNQVASDNYTSLSTTIRLPY